MLAQTVQPGKKQIGRRLSAPDSFRLFLEGEVVSIAAQDAHEVLTREEAAAYWERVSTQSLVPEDEEEVAGALPLLRLEGWERSTRVRALPKSESLLRISMVVVQNIREVTFPRRADKCR